MIADPHTFYTILGILGLLFLLILLVFMAISAYVAWNLVHPQRSVLNESPAQYGLTYQSISFPSRDQKVQLKGWLLPAEVDHPNMTIIFSHGYRGTRLELGLPALSLAKDLVAQGYQVLMYDFRNSGESGGKTTSVGILEKQDLLGAIDWVKANTANDAIGLVGFSMGAATSLITAAEAPEVLGVVSDSSFSQLDEYLAENLSVWSKLPRFPFTQLILLNFRMLLGVNPNTVSPISSIEQIYPRPILFVHGDQDNAIPHSNSVQMQQKHPDVFTLWTVPGVGHVGAYAADKNEYAKRVVDFFDGLVK